MSITNTSPSTKPKILVILGPTASGKSDLSVKLAKKFNGEVISADSRQIYKNLNIGTGKIRKYEMQNIPHHLLDIANPKKTFTASDFQRLGKQAIKKILKKGKLPIICGGTGFYINSLIYNYHLPTAPKNKKLRAKLEKKSAAELFSTLKKLDPKRAKNIDSKNSRRLIRTLEIIFFSKKPISPLKKESPYQILKIGITRDKKELQKRIASRLKKDSRRGLIAESARLHKNGLSFKRIEELGLEYRLIAKFLQGFISKQELEEKLKTAIWRYAKRQLTWFKREKDIFWVKNEKQAEKLLLNFLSK